MDKVKENPKCDIEFIEIDGKVKVKATCQSDKDAIDLKEILENEPFTISVKAKAEIEPAAPVNES